MEVRKKNTVAYDLCWKSQRESLYQIWTSRIPSKELVLKYGFPFLPFYTSSWMGWDFLKHKSTETSQDFSLFLCISVTALFWSVWKILGAQFARCLHWCASPGEFLEQLLRLWRHYSTVQVLCSVCWNHKIGQQSLTTGRCWVKASRHMI